MDAEQIKRANYQVQLSLERSYPAQVEYDGKTYVAACRGLQTEGALTFGGYVYQCDIAFRVRKELMPDPPEEKKLVTWEDQEFRISKVPNRPHRRSLVHRLYRKGKITMSDLVENGFLDFVKAKAIESACPALRVCTTTPVARKESLICPPFPSR